MADDTDQLERIRSKLYDYVSANPSGPNADQARRILGKLPKMSAPHAPGPDTQLSPEDAAAESEPQFAYEKSPFLAEPQAPGRFPRRSPGEAFDPTKHRAGEPRPQTEFEGDWGARELSNGLMAHGLAKVVAPMLSSALAGTKGAQAREIVAEAGSEFDPAAEKAAEALKFKLVPHLSPLTIAGMAGGQMMGHGGAGVGAGILADLLSRNAVPLAGAAAGAVEGEGVPLLFQAARRFIPEGR